MKWKFDLSDFYDLDVGDCIHVVANAKLDEWRRSATVVYGRNFDKDDWEYSTSRCSLKGGDTHRALLIDIEPIEKKECEHDPIWINKIPGWNHAPDSGAECRHCGVKLKATWEAD